MPIISSPTQNNTADSAPDEKLNPSEISDIEPNIQTDIHSDSTLKTKNTIDSSELVAEPQTVPSTAIRAIDTVIAGRVYSIYCPIGEEKELDAAADYINDAITNIRKKAPQLAHENLLVLCCLNLFEQLQQATNSDLSQLQAKAQAESMIAKMLTDLEAV